MRCHPQGYTWGTRTESLLELLGKDQSFDTILAADLVFSRSEQIF